MSASKKKNKKITVRYHASEAGIPPDYSKSYAIIDLICSSIEEANEIIELRKSRFPDMYIVNSKE